MSSHRLTLKMNRDVDFAHARETYVIYPWIRDGEDLVRPIRIGPNDAHIAIARISQKHPNRLQAFVTIDDAVSKGVQQVRAALVRCLQLDYPYVRIEELARNDPILLAALNHRGLGRGKLYPDVFEALCGVVCAQRCNFVRIYGMMQKLAETFGDRTAETVNGVTVYAFPTPAKIASGTEEQLRACSVGFRAKTLANIATYFANVGYSWANWKDRSPQDVILSLFNIKGIGPYTANLAVNLAYGRGGHAHIDTYVVDVIGKLYLKNPKATMKQVTHFVTDSWGEMGETVLDLLTTDTEQWIGKLDKKVGVKSGARK